MTETEKIKNAIHKMCKIEESEEIYELMCSILDYIKEQENMISESRAQHVKEIIDTWGDKK